MFHEAKAKVLTLNSNRFLYVLARVPMAVLWFSGDRSGIISIFLIRSLLLFLLRESWMGEWNGSE